MHVLPPPSPGHEYAQRTLSGQSYITTGLFPIGSPSHRREHLYQVRALIFDADLADALSHQPERYDWNIDPAQTAKAKLYAMDRNQVEELLSVHRSVVEEALTTHLGQPPTVMTMSGYGHHCYYWLPADWGLASDHGPHGADALRTVNKQVVATINAALGHPLLDAKCVDTGTRLMREIGTYNTKGTKPIEVVPVIREPGRLLEVLPAPPADDEQPVASDKPARTHQLLRGLQRVETADRTTTVQAFHLSAAVGTKVKAICPFDPTTTTMGAAWLRRTDTSTDLYCSADHGHDQVNDGCAAWRYPSVLRRGDHVELASRIVSTDLPDDVVFDRGALHVYRGSTGAWTPLESSELERIVMGYSGTLIDGKKPRPLKITHSFVTGVVKCIHDQCHRRGFFDEGPEGIGFANGFLGLDGQLQAHGPERRLLACHKLPFPFDPAAPCPRWERFLVEVFEGDEDAMDKIAFLQEFAGAALMGRATTYQKHPLLWGPAGENGKTVLVETLGALFPKTSQASSSPHDWATPFGKAQLLDARINLVTEVNEQELLDTGPLKAILTGDPIKYEQKYKEAFMFKPRAGHLLAVNSLPATKHQTGGFYRRFVVICFNRHFSEEEQDPTLKDELLKERSGIAAWAVRGAQRRAQAAGYTIPRSAADAEKMWRLDNNSVAYFADECLVAHSSPVFLSKELYDTYGSWIDREGLRPVSRRRFCQRLEALGYSRKRRSQGWMWAVQRKGDAL